MNKIYKYIQMDPKVVQSEFKYSSYTSSQGSKFQSRYTENRDTSQTILKMTQDKLVVSSQDDMSRLRGLQNILLDLQKQFTLGGSKIVFQGQAKDQMNKRLILLENQIYGLLRRRIQVSAPGAEGSRTLDYTGILNQKENQIVQLQKKIYNLEQRLKRMSARQIQIQNELARVYQQMRVKDKIIAANKETLLGELNVSSLLKDALQKAGLQLPNIGSLQIRAESLSAQNKLSALQQLPENKKNKLQLVQMFRRFERMNSNSGLSTDQIDGVLESFISGLQGSKWRETIDIRMRRRSNQLNYQKLRDQFGAAISIMESMIQRVRTEVPNFNLNLDPAIFQMLKQHKINVYKVSGDIIQLERFSEKVIEVPVPDARAKHLLHLFASELKKLTLKYPKLLLEMRNQKLMEFFQQQLIDIIEVDQVDKIVEIIKYVPQVVKVQNVYAYSSEKSRKIQFHLRVLIKALLEELQKIKIRTGVILQLDQGVVGMINQQIMGVVNVDDILKIFRVVHKIVQVQKIVEKVVDRIVQVPQIVIVERIQERIVEVEKIKQVQLKVLVPIQTPIVVTNIVEKIVPVERIVERIIQVPQIIERIVEVTKEVPKIVTVEKFVDRIVEVEKIVEVQRVVNHIEYQIKEVQVIKEVVVPTQEKIVEKIVEVPVIVQKIVQKIVQVPQIIEVEKIIQKIVTQIQYRNAKEIQNHIEVRHQIVDRIIEKPIPIIQTIEKIVEVPQIIERIVQTNTIVKEPYEVPVIRQKIVYQDRIKEIQIYVDRPIVTVTQVIKQVERIVQVPVFHEKIVKVVEIVEKPIIQRSEQTIIKEVYIRQPQIIRQPKIVQVQKIINHYIEVPQPIKYIEEKIVEVIRHVDRIKQVRVPVEKIIEKMVQVPKVVQVQKIVQRIVVVPRVVEKIVEVPQIIERIVQKIIIEEKIKQVERIVQVPVIQERIVEVETVKNVYIDVQKQVKTYYDKIVEVPRYEQKIVNNEVIVEKIVEVIRQVPKVIEVDKPVYYSVEVAQPYPVERQIIVPIQVPIPVEKIIQRIVPVTQIVEKIVQVPQVVEKIVAQRVQQVIIQEIVRVQEKIVIDQRIKEVVKQVPYISEKIKEVVVEREKIVPIQSIVQEIVTAQQIIEKIVERTITVPKIQQIERTKQIMIEVPRIVEIQKIIPQLVNVNRYIEKIVEKIVEVPIIIEQIKEIIRENQKIVQVRNQYETVKQVQRIVEKQVIMEKFKQVIRNVNYIEQVLKTVQILKEKPVAVHSFEERLVEVPYILEKIVEKIVVMPQIVEVLKYVHEVVQEDSLGVAVGVQFATHEQKYKLLSVNIKTQIGVFLAELRKLRTTNPAFGVHITVIEKFIAELQQFILFPRIVQVPKQVIVKQIIQKDRIVQVPVKDERSIRMQLTLSMLVQKLILQLKKIKTANPSLNLQLQDDIKLIFFSQLQSYSRNIGDDFNKKLKDFSDSVYKKFQSLGSWSFDHQFMLNSILQERFLMANVVKTANSQVQKYKEDRQRSSQKHSQLQVQLNGMRGMFDKLKGLKLDGALGQETTIFRGIISQFDQFKVFKSMSEPVMYINQLSITDDRIKSIIRQKDAEISALKEKLFGAVHRSMVESRLVDDRGQFFKIRSQYQEKMSTLRSRILELEHEKSVLQSKIALFERNSTSVLASQIRKSEGGNTNAKTQQFNSPVNTYRIGGNQQSSSARMVQSNIERVYVDEPQVFTSTVSWRSPQQARQGEDRMTAQDPNVYKSSTTWRSPQQLRMNVEDPNSNIYQTKTSWGSQQKISSSGLIGTQSSGIQNLGTGTQGYTSNITGGGQGSGVQNLGYTSTVSNGSQRSGIQNLGTQGYSSSATSGGQSLSSGVQNLSSSIHRESTGSASYGGNITQSGTSYTPYYGGLQSSTNQQSYQTSNVSGNYQYTAPKYESSTQKYTGPSQGSNEEKKP